MTINPDEIESVTVIGTLNGQDVKMIKTLGGFNVGVGAKSKNGKPEALAAGSHSAIVKFQMSTMFGNDFQESMAKSENMVPEPIVEKLSKSLPSQLTSKGIDIYSLRSGNQVEFSLTAKDVEIGKIVCNITGDTASMKKYEGQLISQDISKLASSGLADSIKAYLFKNGVKSLEVEE